MRSLFGLCLIYLVLTSLLLAAGILLGSAVHWILPSIDYSSAVIAGIVGACASLHFFLRFLRFGGFYRPLIETENEEISSSTPEFEPSLWSEPKTPMLFDIVHPRKKRGRKRSPQD